MIVTFVEILLNAKYLEDLMPHTEGIDTFTRCTSIPAYTREEIHSKELCIVRGRYRMKWSSDMVNEIWYVIPNTRNLM